MNSKVAGIVMIIMLGMVPLSWAEETEPQDKPAEFFIAHCADCHTIGGGELAGPDLAGTAAWSPADLKKAVKTMEDNVGALTPEDIELITGFLKDPDATTRIAKQTHKTESVAPALLPPHAFETGQQLFRGGKALANGGSACINCHYFSNEGGSLGPDLTLVKDRLSGVALQSAVENAGFKIMRRIYENKKITKEESLYLSEFLSHPEKSDSRFVPTLRNVAGMAGGGLGVFLFLLWGLNRQIKGRARENLIKKSKNKEVSGQ